MSLFLATFAAENIIQTHYVMEITKIIKRHGFNQAQVAEKMGILRQSFANQICKGNPQVSYLRKIADIIGADIIEFFEDELSKSEQQTTDNGDALICPYCGKEIKAHFTFEPLHGKEV